MSDYTPIDCGIYDELEVFALRRTALDVEWVDAEGDARRTEGARISALRQRGGAEWAEFVSAEGGAAELRLEVRMDRLEAVVDTQSGRRTRISPSCAVEATSRPSRVK